MRVEVGTLPPRLREVLGELLAGRSEKEIALQVGLSRHTVHDHVKRLYRRLDVSSRPELMALFVAAPPGEGDAP